VLRIVGGLPSQTRLVVGTSAWGSRPMSLGGGNRSRHRAWMMRGYAIGLGAGTRALTHVPYFLFEGIQGELAERWPWGRLGDKPRCGRMNHPETISPSESHLRNRWARRIARITVAGHE